MASLSWIKSEANQRSAARNSSRQQRHCNVASSGFQQLWSNSGLLATLTMALVAGCCYAQRCR